MRVRTVLVIDDEEAIRLGVRMTLEDAGYTVLEAADGLEGLNLLRSTDEPLVVLLDLMMPSMSGLQLLHAVGTEPEVCARHAFIIFSAARAFSTPTLNFYLPGKRLFDLPKPFNLDHLVAIVEQAARQLDSESEISGDDDHDKAVVNAPVQGPSAEGTSGGM